MECFLVETDLIFAFHLTLGNIRIVIIVGIVFLRGFLGSVIACVHCRKLNFSRFVDLVMLILKVFQVVVLRLLFHNNIGTIWQVLGCSEVVTLAGKICITV